MRQLAAKCRVVARVTNIEAEAARELLSIAAELEAQADALDRLPRRSGPTLEIR